jgi:hypothetical protein
LLRFCWGRMARGREMARSGMGLLRGIDVDCGWI